MKSQHELWRDSKKFKGDGQTVIVLDPKEHMGSGMFRDYVLCQREDGYQWYIPESSLEEIQP